MINQMLKTIHMSLLKKQVKEKPWRNDILNLPDCSSSAVAAFHFMTKHDCLDAHLYCLDSPAYPLCNSDAVMNADHLSDCTALMKNIYTQSRDSLNFLNS